MIWDEVLKKSHIFMLKGEENVDRDHDKEEPGIMWEMRKGSALGHTFRSGKCHKNSCFICLKHVTWEMVEAVCKMEK